jgi:hypothetical protein
MYQSKELDQETITAAEQVIINQAMEHINQHHIFPTDIMDTLFDLLAAETSLSNAAMDELIVLACQWVDQKAVPSSFDCDRRIEIQPLVIGFVALNLCLFSKFNSFNPLIL